MRMDTRTVRCHVMEGLIIANGQQTYRQVVAGDRAVLTSRLVEDRGAAAVVSLEMPASGRFLHAPTADEVPQQNDRGDHPRSFAAGLMPAGLQEQDSMSTMTVMPRLNQASLTVTAVDMVATAPLWRTAFRVRLFYCRYSCGYGCNPSPSLMALRSALTSIAATAADMVATAELIAAISPLEDFHCRYSCGYCCNADARRCHSGSGKLPLPLQLRIWLQQIAPGIKVSLSPNFHCRSSCGYGCNHAILVDWYNEEHFHCRSSCGYGCNSSALNRIMVPVPASIAAPAADMVATDRVMDASDVRASFHCRSSCGYGCNCAPPPTCGR